MREATKFAKVGWNRRRQSRRTGISWPHPSPKLTAEVESAEAVAAKAAADQVMKDSSTCSMTEPESNVLQASLHYHC